RGTVRAWDSPDFLKTKPQYNVRACSTSGTRIPTLRDSIMLQTLFARHGAAQMGAHTGTPIAEGVQSSPFSMCTAYSYTHTGMCSHLRGARYARPASELVTVSQAEPPPDTPTPGPGTRQRAWRGIP